MKFSPWIVLSVLTAAAAAASACGGGAPTPNVPPPETSASAAPETAAVPSASAAPTPAQPPAATAAPSVSAPPAASNDTGSGKAWDERTRPQQIATMKTVVMPEMGDAFKAFDSKRFAEFNCATCHGVGARDHSFKMPNAELPHLSMKKLKAMADKKSPALKFMAEVVVPKVAAALGEQPFDPKTQKGFGCGGCHVMEKE